MNIAIYGRPVNTAQLTLASTVLQALKANDCKCYIHQPYEYFLASNKIKTHNFSTFMQADEIRGKVDFLFSIGGDGTLLDTTLLVRDSQIPIIGINAGRLGFLSGISDQNFETALQSLAKGYYSIDQRSLLQLESNKSLFENESLALNDFTLHKKETSSMITIHTYLNGEYLNSYWADGVIIATPTGSTGYSLSCGGPIIMPQSENFIITPIAPHNLNVRPIIVSDKNVISLEVEGRSQNFMATMDSRSATIDSTYQLAIKKADFDLKLVRLNNDNFLKTLRSKLNWGLDSRN